jgi:hypothetical protein
MLFEVGQEGTVGERKEAGGIIRHAIGRAGNVVINGEVAMMALVHTVNAEEIRGGSVGGDGAFDATDEGGVVVVEKRHGSVLDGVMGDEDVLMGNNTREFEIGVGDRAVGVVNGNQAAANVGGKRCAPD